MKSPLRDRLSSQASMKLLSQRDIFGIPINEVWFPTSFQAFISKIPKRIALFHCRWPFSSQVEELGRNMLMNALCSFQKSNFWQARRGKNGMPLAMHRPASRFGLLTEQFIHSFLHLFPLLYTFTRNWRSRFKKTILSNRRGRLLGRKGGAWGRDHCLTLFIDHALSPCLTGESSRGMATIFSNK